MSQEMKSVTLVGISIPTSNKKGDGPITAADFRKVKAKVVKVEEPKVEVPHFDFYWNATRSMFNMKKAIIATNRSDEEGFTFFYTENKELLLIQSTKHNPVVDFRPKFLKGPKASNTFTSEFGEAIVQIAFNDLNETVTDGEFYNLSENRYFTLTEVNGGDPNSRVYLVTENAWAAKQPKEEAAPAAEAAPVAETSDESVHAAAEVAEAPVAEVATEEPAADYAAEVTAPVGDLGDLDFANVGEDAPAPIEA